MSYAQMFDNFITVYKKKFLQHILFACGVWAVVWLLGYLNEEFSLYKAAIRAFIESDFGISAANYAIGFIGICLLVIFILLLSFSALSHCYFATVTILKPLKVRLKVFGYLRVVTVVLAQMLVVVPVILLFFIMFYIVCKQTGQVFDLTNLQKVLKAPAFVSLALTFFMMLLLVLQAIFVAFSCAIPIAVIEKRSFFKPLIGSIKWVKGEFWKLYSHLLLWYVALGITALACYFFLYLLGFVINPKAPDGLLWANNIFWIVFTPFVGIVPTVIYRKQSEKMLGLDIICLIKSLEQENCKPGLETHEDTSELSAVYRELALSNSPHYQTDEHYREFMHPVDKLSYAGAGSRLVAAVADLLIKLTLIFCLVIPTFGADFGKLFSGENILPVLGATLVLGLAYFILCETLLNGQTPGKMLLNLRTVADVDGDGFITISFISSLTRNLFRFFVDYSLVGLISIVITGENRRIGDFLAGSYVVAHAEQDKRRTIVSDLLNNYLTKENLTGYKLTKPECFALLSYFIKKSSFVDKGRTVSNYLRPYFSKKLSVAPEEINDKVLFALINLK